MSQWRQSLVLTNLYYIYYIVYHRNCILSRGNVLICELRHTLFQTLCLICELRHTFDLTNNNICTTIFTVLLWTHTNKWGIILKESQLLELDIDLALFEYNDLFLLSNIMKVPNISNGSIISV